MTIEDMPKVNANKWLKHRARYSESRRELKEATLANQAVLKSAKSDGVIIDAMKLVDLFDRRDAMDARSLFIAFVQGAIIQKCEWMVQADLLDGGAAIADLFNAETPSDKALNVFEEACAYQSGYSEAMDKGSVSNLHALFAPGSALLVKALEGWKYGSDLMEKYATPGVEKTPSSGKGRRGKMAAAGDDAEEEVSDPELDSPEELSAEAELDHPLSEPEEPEEQPISASELTRERMKSMKLHELSKAYSEISDSPLRTFPSKAVAIAKIEGYLSQASQGAN